MEEKMKEIVSAFTKIPVSGIAAATPIGRQAVKSSILLHRMYAKLADEGITVENYAEINTWSDLLARTTSRPNGAILSEAPAEAAFHTLPASGPITAGASPSIGIDVEEVAAMPRTNDFRAENFYKMNFAPSEISYCILQPDPYASFAGLFSAKESIVKADGSTRNKSFHTIVISHTEEGKPVYPGYNLSISHAGALAIAVAVAQLADPGNNPVAAPAIAVARSKNNNAVWIGGLALVLSILAIILILIR